MDRLASMETFIRVVETGSFSGAARQLRVGQPAVSKTVAQLESYLGVKLLTRSTRGLTPTEAGLGYFERAKRAIEEADEAELAARGAGTGLKDDCESAQPSPLPAFISFPCCRSSSRNIRTSTWKSCLTTARLISCRRASM
jgi:DNA-binding transcriptional LysR family regulator